MDYESLPLLEKALPFLIPPMVAFFLKVFERLPKWVVPTIVVPGLGIAGQSLSAMMESSAVDPLQGVVYGALAILIREISSKLIKAGQSIKEGERVPTMGPDRWGAR